ncbi:hypothetical protein PFMG_02336 [Plasmodium falciparum IGH-CR14]|uniref:Uncharacterized protein n=1 Tax=Plasmodium falciparum IGH-CR14 TaxID=580059 RepID=A0A0L1IAU3_PLAFA|nr:hypothetical protein PFMG_02336 [Plasmodium falciparum IGH-CR14]
MYNIYRLFKNNKKIYPCFDKKIEICLIHVDFLKNEAYVLLHSRQEVLHFMKLYYVICNNMHFIDKTKRNIEIEIYNEEEENVFWKESKRNCTIFNIWEKKKTKYIFI